MRKEKIHSYQRKYLETNDETNRLLKLAIDLKESFALGKKFELNYHNYIINVENRKTHIKQKKGAQLSIQSSKMLSDEASQIWLNTSRLVESDFNKTLYSLQNGINESKDIIEKYLVNVKARINSSLVNLKSIEAKLAQLNSLVRN